MKNELDDFWGKFIKITVKSFNYGYEKEGNISPVSLPRAAPAEVSIDKLIWKWYHQLCIHAVER